MTVVERRVMSKSLVQQKFGEAAAKYAASPTHAMGPSLARLNELIEPAPTWRHLDIATGAGHTAFVFADKVAKVTASDITKEMLQQVRKLAKERGLGNVVTRQASAEDLPFPDTSYHLVTCRLAAHHFRNPRAFVAEAARVLIPGGTFALVDNLSPGDDVLAAAYNAYEKLRDPSHRCCLSLAEWTALIEDASLTLAIAEVMDQDIPFGPWVARMRCTPATVARLNEMLTEEPLRSFLRPRERADRMAFTLREAIIIARKPA
jgi:ubiquinone/menaquinone biosynthesis C-methylase UbiE